MEPSVVLQVGDHSRIDLLHDKLKLSGQLPALPMAEVAEDHFPTGQVAWRRLLEDTDVDSFDMAAGSKRVECSGTRASRDPAGNLRVDFGNLIVRRRGDRGPQDQYVALQLHPRHPELPAQPQLWHFHARPAPEVEPMQGARDQFSFFDGGKQVTVDSHPNRALAGCLDHYYIDRNAIYADDNAKFAAQGRQYFAAMGSKRMAFEFHSAYKEDEVVTSRMKELANDIEETFGRAP